MNNQTTTDNMNTTTKHLGTFKLHNTDNVMRFYCGINDTLYFSPPQRCWLVSHDPKPYGDKSPVPEFSLDVNIDPKAFDTGGLALDWDYIFEERIYGPIRRAFQAQSGVDVALPAWHHDAAREEYRYHGQRRRNFLESQEVQEARRPKFTTA